MPVLFFPIIHSSRIMNNVRLSTFPITSSVAFTLTRILPIPRTYSRHCREFSHEHDSKIRLKRASTSEAIENDVASSLLFNSKTRLHNSFLRSDDRSGYSVSRVITEDCVLQGPVTPLPTETGGIVSRRGWSDFSRRRQILGQDTYLTGDCERSERLEPIF